jgi:hypothetical protein
LLPIFTNVRDDETADSITVEPRLAALWSYVQKLQVKLEPDKGYGNLQVGCKTLEDKNRHSSSRLVLQWVPMHMTICNETAVYDDPPISDRPLIASSYNRKPNSHAMLFVNEAALTSKMLRWDIPCHLPTTRTLPESDSFNKKYKLVAQTYCPLDGKGVPCDIIWNN